MKALESRKQLLIAESELNRAQLVQVLQTMTGEIHALADQTKTVAFFASVAATLIASLTSLRHKKESEPAGEKSSLLKTIVKGAGLVSTVWQIFRARPKS
jgi:hypothetical protein